MSYKFLDFFMIKIFIILLISLSLLNSCQNKVYSPNTFIVTRYNGLMSGTYEDIAKVNFYKETQNSILYYEVGYQINTEKLDFMMKGFEDYYHQMTNIYGKPTDIDNNGKIIILLVNMNGNVGGVFNYDDLTYGRRNNAEILYFDIISFNNKYDILTIESVFHEFQHLINHNVNFIQKGYSIRWLNETLSESVLSVYLKRGESEMIIPNKYYCFYTWNLERYLDSFYYSGFVNYDSAEEFIWYLFEKNDENPEVFKRIAHSTEREGYNRILSAVQGMGIGNTWEEVLYNFAKYILDRASSFNYYPSNTTVPLYPGAFIFYEENGETKIALNSDTYIGNSPKPIYFTTP